MVLLGMDSLLPGFMVGEELFVKGGLLEVLSNNRHGAAIRLQEKIGLVLPLREGGEVEAEDLVRYNSPGHPLAPIGKGNVPP